MLQSVSHLVNSLSPSDAYISVGNLTVIGSNNGLSPDRRQAIIWTNAAILSIRPLGRNFSEIVIEIYTFSLKKMHLKMLFGKWRPFCLGLTVFRPRYIKDFCHFQVIMKLMEMLDQSNDYISVLVKKLSPPLVTLLSAEPEIQYVALRNINLIVQKR